MNESPKEDVRIEGVSDWTRTDMCGRLTARDAGRELTLMGWLARSRDLGRLLFIELRDHTGEIQIVFDKEKELELWSKAKEWRGEYVVAVRGILHERSPEAVNPSAVTGSVEVWPTEVRLLNTSQTPPFYIRDDIGVEESLRLKYRYLDLRRPELQKNLILRSRANRLVREFLYRRSFHEIETPYLTRSTPEGARDFLVPTRGRRGEFYALPQSPQLFKQLLMLSGFDRYFQLVRCFRDEDFRADRQPEFTQIDLEMSFVNELAVQQLAEDLLGHLFGELWDRDIPRPFPRMDYAEAMEVYGTDKPDLRYELPLVDVSSAVSGSSFQVFAQALEAGGAVKGIVVKGGERFSRKDLDNWDRKVKEWGGAGVLWFMWEDTPRAGTSSVRSPVIKHLSDLQARNMAKKAGVSRGDLFLVMAGPRPVINPLLGLLRNTLAQDLDLLKGNGDLRFLWVVNPPLFERDPGTGQLHSVHHPFTRPVAEDESLIATDPERVRARAYDVVLNGIELGGGSLRIHEPALQRQVFAALGMSEADYEEQFGFLLEAFQYGVPPHGGIAFGMDRLVMVLAREQSLREVIAFPKAASGRDLMMAAPAAVGPEQLRELGLSIDAKKPSQDLASSENV